jgi:hypothetical protein
MTSQDMEDTENLCELRMDKPLADQWDRMSDAKRMRGSAVTPCVQYPDIMQHAEVLFPPLFTRA